MTFPEDAVRAAPRPVSPPNVALGYLLNVLLPGSGFSYIGRWGWHLGWYAILGALASVGVVLSVATGGLLGLLLPLAGFVVMLVHFGRVYAEQDARRFQPPLELAVKIVLIAGHLFLGLMSTGVLAAVLIPNLLAARTRAVATGEQATARQVYTLAMVAQVDGKLQNGPCPLDGLPESQRAQIEQCVVGIRGDNDVLVNIRFTNGRTVTLP